MEKGSVLSSVEWLVREFKRRLVGSLGPPDPTRAGVADRTAASGEEKRGFLEPPQSILVSRVERECNWGETGSQEGRPRAPAAPVAAQIELLRDDIARLQSDLIAACRAWSQCLAAMEGRRAPAAGSAPPPVSERMLRNRQRFLDWVAREGQAASVNGRLLTDALATGAAEHSTSRDVAGSESRLQSTAGDGATRAPGPLAEPASGNGSNGARQIPAAPPGRTAQQSDTASAPTESSAGAEGEARAWLERGVGLTERGQYAGALQAYDRALCIRPDYVEAWLNKGVTLSAQRHYEKALRAYDEALRLSPGHPQIHHYRGIVLAKQERYREALAALDEALRLDPSLVGAWSDKGFVLIRLGFYSDAIAACNEALRLEPGHRGACVNRSRALNLQTRLRQRYPAASESRPKAGPGRKKTARERCDEGQTGGAKGRT